jgi:hypothetical protein
MDQHKEGESSDAGKQINDFNSFCVKSIASEIDTLKMGLRLIDDAIKNRGLAGSMSVWSVINVLTDRTEVEALTMTIQPKSKFHNNSDMVATFVKHLIHWRNERIIRNQDSLARAYNTLIARYEENRKLLASGV